MKTNKLLVAVIALQGMILIGQWTGGGSSLLSSAQAQTSDPANRQLQMIDELKSLNGKMDELIGVLRSGDVQVKVAKAEEEKGKAPAAAPARK
jgi:hypothetical protein